MRATSAAWSSCSSAVPTPGSRPTTSGSSRTRRRSRAGAASRRAASSSRCCTARAARPAARAAARRLDRPRLRPVRGTVVSLPHAPSRRAPRQHRVPAGQHREGVRTTELTDLTLGGYQRVHERAPAFGGQDAWSYSVATLVDDAPDPDGRYGAALLFVRWAEAGDRPV